MDFSLPFRRTHLPWLVELVARLVVALLYRVRTRGAEHVPANGGALVVANHLSYMDPALLQLACPRRIRFVGSEDVRRSHGFFGWLFDVSGTIPVTPDNALDTTRRVIAALAAGEVVCLFPEGSISRTGQLHAIRRGFEVMAKRAGVPVIPVAHDGIWGSIFSFSGNKLLLKSPRLMPTPIFVAWGKPIEPAKANPARVRQAILDLGFEAFEERPVLRRHLARECVRALAKRPGHLEIIDRTAERRPVKAAQLLAAAAALSRHLRRTLPERRVGIVLPPGAGAAIANLAVICAGKVPVNLNFTAGKAAIEAALRIGEVRTVLSAHAVRTKVPNFPWPEQTRDLREEIAAAGGKRAILPWLIAAWLLPNQIYPWLLGLPQMGDRDEAGLLFTSGSSGEPKGVILTHRNILANCWQISSLSILPDSAKLIGCLPIFHSFGFTVTLWYPLIRGCQLVTLPSPLDARKIVDAIREEEATVLVGAPTFLRPVVKKAEFSELRSLDLVVSGAEKMPDDLYRAFHDKHHIEMMQGYGLTETSPVSSVNQQDPPLLTETADLQQGKRTGTVGRMLPGMTARIVDPDTLEEKPLTEIGMLLFRGSNVFPGYLKDAEKTAAAFYDGWFVTGDLARFDQDGFLTIEGRLSRFSKIGGEMVPHGTVEQTLVEVLDLDQSEGPLVVVIGVPDSSKGEALVLVTSLDLTSETIREKLLAAGLPALWVPRVIVRVEKIPVLGTGKLDLKSCKQIAAKAGAG
jgi:acyl-[acyl-carrier-protein]-phospholipid O-acyltransferase/long-chain-fatty-acid--[acyl-carrier-protein] ligase